jgi:hypothetical protein
MLRNSHHSQELQLAAAVCLQRPCLGNVQHTGIGTVSHNTHILMHAPSQADATYIA